ncbi:hypothetical protein [Roseomonas fluvialis]|uniref:Uncharacterized protein n=1 Tax=Roseomonas fluvialis TaxID=1750527 RepID=A0ABN6NWW7_9PROT|nr:hypothetical protein [Roseomonas fluvialis]BDG70922.1 hypothetical protein Rmf_08510 [Roseomonas fluvialis]
MTITSILLILDEPIDVTASETATLEITDWHVERPDHGVLVAEGMPAECCFDDGNRNLFDHGGAVALFKPPALARNTRRSETLACHHVLLGPMLDALRSRHARRRGNGISRRARAG